MNQERPPRLFVRFLQWYCNPVLLESIIGDLEEQFDEDIKQYGLMKARRKYAWTTLRFFRKGIIRPLQGSQKLNFYGMLKNDFKTSLRIIKHEKLYSAINILGLSAGFIIAILILYYVQYEQSYESYNPNSDKVVRITMDYLDGEDLIDQDCETYHLLGPMIKDEFPEVSDFTRAFGLDGVIVEVDEEQFREAFSYAADPSFLQIFGYSYIHGDPETALTNVKEVVLPVSTALKYFGKTDAIGEEIKFYGASLKVVGVVNDPPPNTHLKFDLLLSYISMKETLEKRDDQWDSNDTYTYLQLNAPEKYADFKLNLSALSDRLRAEDLIPDERIISEKIRDIHLYSDKSYEPEQNGSATIVYFLLGVALLVIIIAILNYINLSTAKAMDRAKEAGIRKIMGSSIPQIRIRFFIESVLLNLFAGILSIVIIWLVFDSYKRLAGLPETLQIFNNVNAWILLGALVLGSTILSGIFPAFMLGSFNPMAVLKGQFSHSSSGILLRKALVVVQFSIAIFLLIQTFTAQEQLSYMINKDLGMNTNQVIVINAPNTDDHQIFGTLRNSLIERPQFKNVTYSSVVPGLPTSNMSSTTNIQLDEDPRDLKNNFFLFRTDSNFLATLELELVAGHNYTEFKNMRNPIIVNEEALRIWGIADPEEVILKKSTFWGKENTIVGVVKDFHQLGAKSSILPMILVYFPNYPDYISVRLGDGEVLEQVALLEEVYREHFPHSPFDTFFLDQNFDAQYRADVQFQQIFSVLSGFALLITCLGLFGLASFTVAKRTKEIGIRKVLGASVSQIIQLISKDFVFLVIISSVIAIPVTYLLVENWLNQYSYRISINIWLFVAPVVVVLLISFATVLSKAFQASLLNPAESLRDE